MVDPRLRIINEAPRPRVLLLNPPPGVADTFAAVFPTCREISSLTEIKQHEWDLLVTWSGIPEEATEDLFVVGFGDPGDRDGVAVQHGQRKAWSYYHLAGVGKTNATQLAIGTELPAGVERSANRLLQAELQEDEHDYLAWSVANLFFYRGVAFMEPFCATADGDVLAGSYMRGKGEEGPKTKAWLVARTDIDFLAWGMAAAEDFANMAPDRFPQRPAWQSHSEWMTAAEGAAEMDRQQAESESATAEERVRASHALAYAARADGDKNQRCLLTGRGTELVVAVIEALRRLGFTVENRDATLGDDSARVEDLIFTDDSDPNWIAVAEVRSFAGEMSLDTIRRLDRFADLFKQTHGREPSRRIAIANTMRGHDPSARPPLLRAHAGDAESFGARGGLAIDTAELFKLVKSVELGNTTEAEARASIRTTRGVFASIRC